MTPHASQEGTPRTDEQVDDPYSVHLMNDRAERHDEAGRQRFGLTLCKEVVPADFSRTLELENLSLQRRLGEAEGREDVRRDFLRERIKQYLCVGGLFNPEMMEHDKVRDLIMDLADWMDGDKPRANLKMEIDASRATLNQGDKGL